MNQKNLSEKLNEMYFNAPKGETATMVHLFGVKYSKEIEACEYSPKEIAKLAGISENYGVEINKGKNLAKYVKVA
ncbi:hypothetical protein M3P05_20700 [Sansalvadorimonas sp. 2012CJ34-2]|uniref:HTH-like domain-containing protein n=1 Tax=Parendozoicomonas callyspongiae TaxID=2942213 RepID=A0ABT0PLT7_9GAMM|nr:hypothetical protein [Sansalvadorimonas sp. 2012CJ34-2]MCL6272340.1 hypothetical protein [Sansalvadorimonas sp. 2012CJ34-2]